MKRPTKLARLLVWRKHNITDYQFTIFLSIIVGILVGFAAVIIKNFVRLIHELLSVIASQESGYLYILYPLAGIFLVILFVKYINKNPVRHGIPSVLYSISKTNGIIKRHNIYSSIITSALTVGFGGSVGLEGPSVVTGAAIGSNIGRFLRLNYKQIILLLGCASAGAMAAIFKAPVAAIVFALEVIMIDLTMSAIVPLLISSATAAFVSYLLLGQNYLYSFEIHEEFILSQVWFFILLGIITGLISVYFTKMYMIISGVFERIRGNFRRWLIGGTCLGIFVFLIPSLFGEGYTAINESLRGDISYLFDNTLYAGLENSVVAVIILFLLVIFLKVIATSVTFGSGGVGGVFAPTLFTGANVGLLFAKVINMVGFDLPESNFALVGMAGLIAGVIHAPLTAIFLIAEITGGYELFFPLMIVAAISYATVKIFVSNSVYTIQLAKRGELITHHKDKAMLMMMNVRDLIETDFNVVHPDERMRDLVNVISHAHRNIFPVVGSDKTFRGIVKMDDIRHIMFNPELYDNVYVRDLMFMPEHIIDPEDPMEEIARKFKISGRYNIVVIEKGKYLGFVSRAKLFSSYRKLMEDFSED
ncbi:MAG: chloride channel protein [Bacteroidales bacterium]|nr:chloride channel protein [Bacteroidales bacterium]